MVALAAVLVSSCSGPVDSQIESLPLAPAPTLDTPMDTKGDSPDPAPSSCDTWNPEALEWRQLETPRSQESSTTQDAGIAISRTALPPVEAERYNVGVEVCPEILLVITHDGSSRFVSLQDWSWASGPTFETSGETERVNADGVSSGGPTWGFRDGLIADGDLFLSDAVIDTEAQCVRVDVHRFALAEVLDGSPVGTVILETTPCVSYTDSRRSASSIRTHMGSALAYDDATGILFVTIGDLHLGASTIGQAAGIGLEGTVLDYEILQNPSNMVGAVVAIGNPHREATSEVFAKGLRNSLGMLIDNGALWLSDHGPSGGDELNVIEQGENYGWPLTSRGRPYDRSAWPSSSSALLAPWLDFQDADIAGAREPVASWTPAIAPTELALYPADGAIDMFRGRMLLATLRAQELVVIDTAAPSEPQGSVKVGARSRDMTVTDSGAVVLLTDSSEIIVFQPSD